MVSSEILLLTAVISLNGVALYSAFLKTKNEIEALARLLRELNTFYYMANKKVITKNRKKQKLLHRKCKSGGRYSGRGLK